MNDPNMPVSDSVPSTAGNATSTGHALDTSLRDTTSLPGGTSHTAGTDRIAVPEASKHTATTGPPADAAPHQTSTAQGLKDATKATTDLHATSRTAGNEGLRINDGSKHADIHGPPVDESPATSSTAAMMQTAMGATSSLHAPPRKA